MHQQWNSVGDLGNGLACQDRATGSGFIMYSSDDVHTRFAAKPPYKGSAQHFVCVKYDGGWKYDTNGAWVDFTAASTDVLVAAASFSTDTVSDLRGKSGTYQNIAQGYASGDLKFKADQWKGGKNDGEFFVGGTGFNPNQARMHIPYFRTCVKVY